MTNRLAFALLMIAVPLRAEEPRHDRFGDPLPQGALARLGTIHTHPAASGIAFSGRTVITTTPVDVGHWDADTARIRKVTSRPVSLSEVCQAISADGRVVATVTEAGLQTYDLEHDRLLHRVEIGRLKELVKSSGVVRSFVPLLAISPRGDLVVLQIENATELLAIRDGRIETWPGPAEHYEAAVFSADGRWLALKVRADKGAIVLRDTARAESVARVADEHTILAVAPDGARIVTGSERPEKEGQKVRVLEAKGGKVVPGGELVVTGTPQAACFSGDGRLLAITTEKEILLWDAATKRTRWRVPAAARCLAFSPDSRRLASVDAVLRTWDVETGKPLGPDLGPIPGRLSGSTTRNGRIVLTNFWNTQLQVWDWATGRPLLAVPCDLSGEATTSWLSADGRRLHAFDGRTARVWDVDTGRQLAEFNPLPAGVAKGGNGLRAAMETRDGTGLSLLLAQGTATQAPTNGFFLHCDANTGKELFRRELTLPAFQFVYLTVDAWGIGIYTHGAYEFRVLDARLGRNRPPFEADLPAGLNTYTQFVDVPGERLQLAEVYRIEPDSFHETHVLETASRKPLLQIRRVPVLTRRGNTVDPSYEHEPQALSRDSRWLAIGKRDGVELWDLVEQKKVPFPSAPRTSDFGRRSDDYPDELGFLSNTHLMLQYGDKCPLIWELPPATRTPPTLRITATTWDDLAGVEPLPGQRAVWALNSDPKTGVELLRRVPRVNPPAEPALAALYAELGSNRFTAREAATRRLREMDRQAELFLAAALARPGTPEQHRRARLLLAGLQAGRPHTADERRAARVVQAADLIGGDAVRALLTDWAKGDPTAVLTREAEAALLRQQVRP